MYIDRHSLGNNHHITRCSVCTEMYGTLNVQKTLSQTQTNGAIGSNETIETNAFNIYYKK